jgi:hypothetical protein
MRDSFYEELGRVFAKPPEYNVKILLGNFNYKIGKENFFKPTIGNENLTKVVMIMVLRATNFCHIQTLIVKSTMFILRNINKCIGHLLMERLTTKLP